MISRPLLLLDLVNKHKVSYTFAPNFFLALLFQALHDHRKINIQDDYVENLQKLGPQEVTDYFRHKGQDQVRKAYSAPHSKNKALTVIGEELTKVWDLGSLRAIISGGESNVVETCGRLTDLLQDYNAPCAFIRPGFGMTETCAGCIYSMFCPTMDQAQKLEFASVGIPMQDVKMRVTDNGDELPYGQTGRLELNGLVVFDRYYRDPISTAENFTKDGWFITGDNARIDNNGRLHIIGRQKDVMCING